MSVIGILLLPALCGAALDLLRKPEELLWRQHLAAIGHALVRHLQQMAFELACLPYEAYYSLDAIVRTVWRMRIAHKRLLEWNPSSESNRNSPGTLAAEIRAMWIAPVFAIAVTGHLLTSTPVVLLVAGPILLLWFFSPLIVWWVSRPLAHRTATLTVEQTLFLRGLARRTWAFFDHFVGAEDHWLPPDNYQEYRVAAIAHRTSPTNMGMALLANLAAYDFGYLPAGQLVERTAHTLATMDGLERHRGHFYNWYDTQTLQPLLPRYISTVDSGNLAGHLLTLRAGLLVLADDRIVPARLLDGLSDTFRLIEADLGGTANGAAGTLAALRSELEAASNASPCTLAALRLTLSRQAALSSKLATELVARRGGKDTSKVASQFASATANWLVPSSAAKPRDSRLHDSRSSHAARSVEIRCP